MRLKTKYLTTLCLAAALFVSTKSKAQHPTPAHTENLPMPNSGPAFQVADTQNQPPQVIVECYCENQPDWVHKTFETALSAVIDHPPENGENPLIGPKPLRLIQKNILSRL